MGTLRDVHPNPRLTERLVENRFFEDNPLVVVDVGARKGFEKHWDYYKDQCRLFGFEPNEDSFKECLERKSNEQTTYYPFALDIEKGERDFYHTSYLSSCGFYKPDKKIVKRFGSEDVFNITHITKVNTIDLDSIALEVGLPNIDFIKLDTEGSELDILKGAEKALKSSVLGLSIEVEFLRMYLDQPLFPEVDQYLQSLNFELYDLDLNRRTRKALAPHGVSRLDLGQLVQGQALYFRNAIDELDSPETRRSWNKERILKLACIQELFNLPDCAIELIQKGDSLKLLELGDAGLWTDLLVPIVDGEDSSYEEYLSSLRVTNPRVHHLTKRKFSKAINKLPEPLPSLIRHVLLKIRDFINLFL